MTENRLYRINTPVEGVHWAKSEKTRITLPAGAIVELLNGIAEGARIIGVKWEGRILMMLRQDIQVHASCYAAK